MALERLIGVNTPRPNALVREALDARAIPELGRHETACAEVKYGREPDRFLEAPDEALLYLEVKTSTSRARPALRSFRLPRRAERQAHGRVDMAQSGARAAVLFVVQREDCTAFSSRPTSTTNSPPRLTRARARGVLALA
ncbi:MAG: DNA/RNA nuclease SfsA [Alphaproteobacteria bacterium]